MKPKTIRRDVQSRRPSQSGPAINVGRVARVRDSGPRMKAGSRSRRGSRGVPSSPQEAARRRNVMLVWSVALVVVSSVIIGVFMMFWLKSHGHGGDVTGAQMKEENIRVVSKFVSPGEAQALDLVKRALATRDPREVGSVFRLGGAEPAEVVSFLSESGERDGRIERMDWLGSMDVSGLLADGVIMVYSGKVPAVERLAFLVPDDAGVWKLDFESFSRSSRPGWSELLDGRADRARVRVLLARDSYFNGPYLDESRWVCFAMVSPDTRGILDDDTPLLHGYCRVDSPQAKALERILAMGNRMNRVTLELHRAEGAGERQFEISRVLSEDWVLAPKPYDERFE